MFVDASEVFGSTVGNDNNIGFLFYTKNVMTVCCGMLASVGFLFSVLLQHC